MVRSALATRGALHRGPRAGAMTIPALSVVLGSCVALLPIVAEVGWFPDAGLLMLLGWRLLRGDVWPAWWAAPLGFANDLITGNPIGLSVALWTAIMLVLDLTDRRTMWRDYWIEWALAALFIVVSESAHWRVAALTGAPLDYATILPSVLIAVLAFPLAARLVSALDRWRLGR